MPSIQVIQILLGCVLSETLGVHAVITTVSPIHSTRLTLQETTAVTAWYLPLNITTGDNQQMTCEVTGDAKSKEYFTIYPGTCLLTLVKALDNDPDDSLRYDVLVQYYNTSEPSAVSYISVTILVSRNQHGPVFTPGMYSTRINDFAPAGTSVITVTALDNDIFAPNNRIFYTLSEEHFEVNDYFTIHPYTGLITVTRHLSDDPTKRYSYRLLAIASDMSCQPRSSTGTVMVMVSRNTAPMFLHPDSYTAFVSEAASVLEDTILTVTAVDSDLNTTVNGQLTYSIRSEKANRVFLINSRTGAITPRVDLRRVPIHNWIFEVEVKDAGVPPLFSFANVSIIVQMAAFPTFSPSEYETTIPENQVINSTIISVAAFDPVSGTILLYELRGDGIGPSFFSVNRQTGDIYISKSLQDDSTKSVVYILRIVAFRQSDKYDTAEAVVKVNVVRNPQRPVFSAQSQNAVFDLHENQAVGVVFGNISAVDSDGNIIDYTISSNGVVPPNALSYFFINPRTGTLMVTLPLSSDPLTTQYQLTVIATDKGNPPRWASTRITVRVLRNPNPPRFQQNFYSVTVPESLQVTQDVVNVTATDTDGDSISYAIPTDPPASLYFHIDVRTGQITLAYSLSQDIQDSYLLRVIATDNGQPPKSSTATVSVFVMRNPNYPIFQDHPTVNISEYALLMSTVLEINATDADNENTPGGQLRYSISNAIPNDSVDYFIISPTTGDIFLARPLSHALSPDRFVLSVTASDLSNIPKTATTQVTINIIRNLHTPVFDKTEAVAYMNGTDPVGKVIAVVNATDADAMDPLNRDTPNADIKYDIIKNNDQISRAFGVDEDGQVFIKEPLYSYEEGNYTLIVVIRAQDSGWDPRHSDMMLTVHVAQQTTDVIKLGFTQPVYIKNIFENAPTGEVMTLEVANQQDNLVRCYFVDDNQESKGPFALKTDHEGKNCILTLREELDREERDRYHLNVGVDLDEARSKRAAGRRQIYNTWRQTEINLFITDVNDNAPIFAYPEYPTTGYDVDKYYAAISISAKPREVVTKISASDTDEGQRGQVVFYTNTTEQSFLPFHVSSGDGILSTTMEFDSSSPRHYRFPVHARDNPVDSNPRDSTTNVVVNLIDEHNRFILVLSNKTSEEIIPVSEELRRSMQKAFGYLTVIETIQAKRTLLEHKSIAIDTASTDVIFVLVGNKTDHGYSLLNNTDHNVQDTMLSEDTQNSLKSQLNIAMKLEVQHVRSPYSQHMETTTVAHVPSTAVCAVNNVSSAGIYSYTLEYLLILVITALALETR